MNIVIPMAGRGSRLAGHPSGRPKPFIEVHGKPLWWWAASCLPLSSATRIVFVCLSEHFRDRTDRAHFEALLPRETAEVIEIDDVTEGQLCTVMKAKHVLDQEQPLLVFNADTWFEHDANRFESLRSSAAGVLGLAKQDGDQWSFAEVDGAGSVVRVVEKERISEHACTGMYYFASTTGFLSDAETMIETGRTVRGEYYISPIYDLMISRGELVLGAHARSFMPIGTLSELEEFEQYQTTRKVRSLVQPTKFRD